MKFAKHWGVVISIFIFALCHFCFAVVRTTAILSWDYPPSEIPNVSFNIYFSTNIATPVANWTLITNVTGTNTTVAIAPGNGFWFATASNEFGESIPSNIATSTVARNVNGVKIK